MPDKTNKDNSKKKLQSDCLLANPRKIDKDNSKNKAKGCLKDSNILSGSLYIFPTYKTNQKTLD